MPTKLTDLVEAYNFAGLAGSCETRAYVHRMTGEVFLISEDMNTRESPEDMEESDEFLALPSKRDLRLGRDLVLSFVDKEAPEEWENVCDLFSRKGAYGRFKRWLQEKNKLDAWYKFEEEATRQALRDWCEDNEIPVADD